MVVTHAIISTQSWLRRKQLLADFALSSGFDANLPIVRGVNLKSNSDHVLEGRRSQGGLTPNSLEFDLLGAFRC